MFLLIGNRQETPNHPPSLNTSHVLINPILHGLDFPSNHCLNTSHVLINLITLFIWYVNYLCLNTSHVLINHPFACVFMSYSTV